MAAEKHRGACVRRNWIPRRDKSVVPRNFAASPHATPKGDAYHELEARTRSKILQFYRK